MRQAGRSLPAYRELRQRYGLVEITRQPDLCAEVTLMPIKVLDVDAAIMFADIMLPHLGASTKEANYKAALHAAEQLIALDREGKSAFVVN